MKLIYQLCIILLISFIGEILRILIPLPVPASIYGLVIMLFCLITKIIKLEKVKQVGYFLLEIMPMLFIPVSVGLIATWGELSKIWLPVLVIAMLTTIIVMVTTGKITEFILSKGKRVEK